MITWWLLVINPTVKSPLGIRAWIQGHDITVIRAWQAEVMTLPGCALHSVLTDLLSNDICSRCHHFVAFCAEQWQALIVIHFTSLHLTAVHCTYCEQVPFFPLFVLLFFFLSHVFHTHFHRNIHDLMARKCRQTHEWAIKRTRKTLSASGAWVEGKRAFAKVSNARISNCETHP